jgi:hypothetical protein
MMRHRRKCEGKFSYSCEVCAKQFHRRDLYKEHMATNHRVAPIASLPMMRSSSRLADIFSRSHDLALPLARDEEEGMGEGLGNLLSTYFPKGREDSQPDLHTDQQDDEQNEEDREPLEELRLKKERP